MTEIGYGLVGSGYFGAAIGRAVNALPNARIVAVLDPDNAHSVATELNAEVATDIDTLCRLDDVTAVIVASPNSAHREPTIAAARAGKQVFCEKPIALSYSDCRLMVEATADAGVLFMAGHVTNFMSGVRRAKQLIADGAIGDVLFCRAIRNGWEEPQPAVNWKKMRDLSGGHLYHHIHELDLVQFLMGPASRVTMVGGNVAHRGENFGDEDDMLLITLEFSNGTFASLEYGSAFRWPEHYVLIEGTLGAIKIDMQDVGVTLRRSGKSESFLLHRSAAEDDDRARIYRDSTTDGAVMYGNPQTVPPLWLRGIIEEELTYFDGLVRGGKPLPELAALTDGSAAMAAIASADALTLSLREDRKVDVSEITREYPAKTN